MRFTAQKTAPCDTGTHVAPDACVATANAFR